MKLSFEQIKSIAFGTTNLWQEEDGIHFRRCTQAQIDSWYESRENLGDGSTRTTGISLDFHTDSPWLTLIFSGCNQLDILVDGPFVLEKKDLSLRFRGSSNQRILNVPASLERGEAVAWDNDIE